MAKDTIAEATKGPKAAEASNSSQLYRAQIASWVAAYFSNEYFVSLDDVSASHELKSWGYGDPARLALLAGNYNRSTASRPLVRPAPISPPELIAAVLGGQIQDLIDFLTRKHEESTLAFPTFQTSLEVLKGAADAQLSTDVEDLLSFTDVLYQKVWNWTCCDLQRQYSGDVITPTASIANVFVVDGDIEQCARRFKFAVVVTHKFGSVRDPDNFSISTDKLEALRAGKKALAQLAQLFTQSTRLVLEAAPAVGV